MKICGSQKRKEKYSLKLARKGESPLLPRKWKHPERTGNLGEDQRRKMREYQRRYFKINYKKNPNLYKDRSKRRYEKNKEWYAEYGRRWLKKHRSYSNERHRTYMKAYRRKNRMKLNQREKRYYMERYLKDISWTIGRRLSARLRGALKRKGIKSHGLRVFPLLGCSMRYFKHYIEKQFKLGMTWRNIQIDHIRPIASFNLKIPKQQKECFFYKNMRPMWPPENNRKGSVWRGKRYKRRNKRR